MTGFGTVEVIDKYIAQFPAETREKLEELRSIIHALAPKATEKISYGIPTFDLSGHHLIHFAGYKNHIGFYPGARAIEIFCDDLSSYKTSKGTIQFPLDRPFPVDLVTRIIEFRIEQGMNRTN